LLERLDSPVASRERLLLALGGAFVLVNQITLLIARERAWTGIWPVGVWIVCAVIGHLILERRLPERDPLLFPLAMFLTGWGLNLIARLVPPYVERQALWLVVGLAALLAVTLLPGNLRWLRRYRYTWLIGGLGLLALSILVGINPAHTGPRLWIWSGLGRIYYQPSELLKILLVAFLASYFAENQRFMRAETIRIGSWEVPSPSFLGPLMLMWGICVVVLVWQRDLGTATLFFVVFTIMLYLASGQAQLLVGGVALLLVASVIAYNLFGVVRVRVDIWFNPWPTADSEAAGGVFGQGIGQGQPQIIPVAHSDFVFAALAEEWGLVGVLGVLIALAALVVRGMRIAVLSRQPFRALLAAGLSLVIGVQSLLIMGGVLKLVPLTGVTLPFVSYGGSSLLTCYVIVGLLLVLSEEQRA
jgi:cell division protein FtsW (lipid II flippase)